MGNKRKKNINVLNKKSTVVIKPIIEEKEVVEQEIHIKEISEQEEILENDTNLSELENDNQPQSELLEEIIPEPIIQQILDYYPEKNDDDEVVEEKPTRTLQSLSKSELRFYQRTGMMPK